MGVLIAGVRVRLDRPGTPHISDIYAHRAAPGASVRGFLVINESSATVLVNWRGGQPGGSSDYQHTVGAFEAAALPISRTSDSGTESLWFFSTDPTAQFIYSLYDEPVQVFLKSNPATVPTAAAVKLEDRAVSGRWALVGADGSVLISGAINVSNFPASQTVNGTVTGNQGAAAGIAGRWPVYNTDGVNSQAMMDVAARRGYVTHTDGVNNQPAGDAAARAIYVRDAGGAATTFRSALLAATATLIIPANVNRKEAYIRNTTGQTIALGNDATVTATGGGSVFEFLPSGAVWTSNYITDDIYAVATNAVAAGTLVGYSV